MKDTMNQDSSRAKGFRHRGELNWGMLSRFRNELLGLSAIFVVLYHFTADLKYSALPGVLHRAAVWYYACLASSGIGSFLFLSGMGLWFSMSKGIRLRRFLGNRFRPLFLTYGIWGLVFWGIADYIVRGAGEKRFLTDYFLISFWTRGDRSFWYIASIAVFFAVFPLLYRLLAKGNHMRFINLLLLLAADAVLCLLLKSFKPAIYGNIEICLLRFPAFLAGAWYGEKVRSAEPFSLTDLILIVGVILFRMWFIVDYTVWGRSVWVFARVPYDAAAIVLMLLAALLFQLFDFWRLRRCLTVVGRYTLEIYLTHLSIWNLLCYFGVHGPVLFFLILVIAVPMSLMLHEAVLWASEQMKAAATAVNMRAESYRSKTEPRA